MKHLLTRSWLLKHLFALVILLTMLRLGFWQLDRLAQRRALNNTLIAALEQAPQPLNTARVDPDALHFHKVRVTGSYDNAQTMMLRNQQRDGENGVHLLTPLRIEGSEQVVIVDRGWLPENLGRRENRGTYAVSGEVSIEGIAMRSQPRPDAWLVPMDLPLPGESRIDAWVRVDLERMQTQLPYPLLPIFIRQSPDAAGAANTLPLPQGLDALDEGPHLGYALQWFTFSAMLVVVYSFLIRQELKPKTRPQQRRAEQLTGERRSDRV